MERKEIAPDTTPNDKQGIDMPYKIGISYIGDRLHKTLPFDVHDTLPGCYQEYKGEGDCIACLYRLPCARMTQGGNNE